MTKTSTGIVRLFASLVPLIFCACLGVGGGLEKEPVSGLWVGLEEIPYLQEEMTEELAAAGIRELFIPLAKLDLKGSSPLERDPLPELETSMTVNLVITGRLELGEREGAEAAQAVGDGVQQMLFDAEARGIVPSGVHFDLRKIDSIRGAADFFEALRDVLPSSTFLSISLRRSWMQAEDIEALVKAVDYVVPFLYGQRAWERDDDEAWAFHVVEERLAQVESYDVPYMMGIIGIGNATQSDRNGKIKAYSSAQTLANFLWNRDLELKRGFSLEATNRRVYTVEAERATQAGGWDLATKDKVRLVRPMTTDLDQLLDVLQNGHHPSLLGQLYFRLPSPDERMSLTLENILNANGAEPVTPDLDFEVQVTRRTRRGLLLRFTLSNLNGETTELSLLDNNYLQITTADNLFGQIKIGDFYRYDLLRADGAGNVERTFRNANTVRLHIPILEGQQSVVSGEIEIKQKNPELTLEAKFLMPDGRTVTFGPYPYKDGEFQGPEREEEEGEGEGGEGEDGEGEKAEEG